MKPSIINVGSPSSTNSGTTDSLLGDPGSSCRISRNGDCASKLGGEAGGVSNGGTCCQLPLAFYFQK